MVTSIGKQRIRGRQFTAVMAALPRLAGFALLLLTAASQAQDEAGWQPARTEYGHPDLQGLWTYPFQTPTYRPAELGNKASYSEAEAQELVARAHRLNAERSAPLDPGRPPPARGGTINNQADGNFEIMPIEIARVDGEYRTSLVVDPPDGRLPYQPGNQDIFDQRRARGHARFDGPEMLTPLDRCLTPGGPLPMLFFFGGVGNPLGNPAGDNPVRNIQIVQNRDYVMILSEYFSLVRIIRIDKEFMPGQGARWMGDSIGYYEGDSLVVRSRQFRPEQSTGFLKTSEELTVTERFTPVGDGEMLFRYTITDPRIYSQPVTAEVPLRRMAPQDKLYEYACHEGNYAIPSMLRAARMEEAGLI